jgi:FMN phosphatase YigB (HAD superfamily)
VAPYILTVAWDYGGTISGPDVDADLASKPVSGAGVALVRALAARRIRQLLASNTLPHQDRRPALDAAGVAHHFAAVLLSHPLGVAKPDPAFFAHVLAAANAPPDRVLYVGNNYAKDAIAPVEAGMRAALLRPDGLSATEHLPTGAVAIRTLNEVLGLIERPADWWETTDPCA